MPILRSLSDRVLGGIFLGQRSKPSLRFGGLMLKEAKSLSNYYGIHGRGIHQLKKSILCANKAERPKFTTGSEPKRPEIPNITPEPKSHREQDQPSEVIWKEEYDKILLDLFIKYIPNGGRNMLHHRKDSWCGIVDEFNKSTGLKCDYEYLYKCFNSYACEYEIVNRIRHHQKFRWDHQCQKIIATDDDWNEYIKRYPIAKFCQKQMPYFDLLEKVFGDK